MSATELLRNARSSFSAQGEEPGEIEERDLALEDSEVQSLQKAGIQEGASVQLLVTGTFQGGSVVVQTVTPAAAMEPSRAAE